MAAASHARRTARIAETATAASSHTEILIAAAETFMQFGFAGATLDAIAERLGSTKGRIYHHFDSKLDLYFAVQIEAIDRLERAVAPIASEALGPLEKLERMAFRHAQMLLTDFPIQKVSLQGIERRLLAATSPGRLKAHSRIVAARDAYEQMFADVIDEGARAGLFISAPPRLATKPLFGSLNWATVWYSPRARQDSRDIDAIATLLARHAVRGLLVDRDAGDDIPIGGRLPPPAGT